MDLSIGLVLDYARMDICVSLPVCVCARALSSLELVVFSYVIKLPSFSLLHMCSVCVLKWYYLR
jgi:hypothetical protein